MTPPAPEDLLQHAGFLARLARELVGDEHAAADLVQDAYAAALTSPPREAGSLRGWLAIVLRNRARNQRREAGRRARREAEGARSEVEPARDLPLERLEIQRGVVEELMALSEEKRTVLYLRYSEDLSPSQIARRLGVPVKTVKTRHTRAVAELRARLDARAGGDRTRWVSALLVLRAPRVGVPGGAAVGSAAALVGAVAVVTLVWSAQASEPRQESAVVARGPAAEARTAEALADAGASRSSPVAARTPLVPEEAVNPVPAPEVPLSGRVVDRAGAPVAEARILARWEASFRPERAPDRVVQADAQGRFRLRIPAGDFTLTAEAPGLTCESGLRGTLAPESQARELELVLAEALDFHGRVTDLDGRPLAGVEVGVHADSSTSDRDATTTPGVRRFYPVHLEARSDAAGEFTLGPAPRRDWNVRLTHPEHLRLDAGLDPALELQEFALDPGHAVSGRVLCADGTPARDAVVTVRDAQVHWRKGTTASDGRFTLRGLAACDDAFVLVDHPSSAVFARQPVRIGPGGGALELVLEAPVALRGRVVDTEGLPLAGAEVRVVGDRRVVFEDVDFGEETTWEWALDQSRTRTDAEGSFLFPRLYAGTFEVRATPADAPELAVRTRARSGGAALELVLDRRTAERTLLAGRVTDAATGEPVRAFVVTPMRPREVPDPGTTEEEPEPGWVVTTVVSSLSGHGRSFGPEAEGRFRIAGEEPGNLQLRIRADGYAPWDGELRAYPTGETWHEVRLWKARGARFVVRDTEGQALDARLVFQDLDGRALALEPLGGTAASIPPGGGVVAGLPATVVRVEASAPNCRARPLELDLARRDLEAPIEIVLERDRDWDLVELHLLVLVSADSDLAGLRAPQEIVPAWVSGRARVPAEEVRLAFLDGSEAVLARATLAPEPSGGFRVTDETRTASDGSSWSEGESESEEPSLSLDVPAGVRWLEARIGARAPIRLPLALFTDENLLGLVLAVP